MSAVLSTPITANQMRSLEKNCAPAAISRNRGRLKCKKERGILSEGMELSIGVHLHL
jgi:hypothetical protein